MNSWRDGTSDAAQADIDRLITEGMDQARANLEKYGTFYPFVVTIERNGADVTSIDLEPEEQGHPCPGCLEEAVSWGLVPNWDQTRAMAFVEDRPTSFWGSPCVKVEVAHVERKSFDVVMKYSRSYRYEPVQVDHSLQELLAELSILHSEREV